LLGICGVAMLTVSGTVSPQYTPYPTTYGDGFYLLWALAVVQLGMAFISRRKATSPANTQTSV